MLSMSLSKVPCGQPRAISPSLAFTALQWCVLAVAFAGCLQGGGRQFRDMLCLLAVPALRAAADRSYRSEAFQRLGQEWQRIIDYADASGAVPWKAVFWFIVYPAVLINLSTSLWTHRSLAAGDSWPVIPSASSVVTEGNLEISGKMPLASRFDVLSDTGLPYFVERSGARIYSSYPAGMLVFATPVCLAARICGADLNRIQVRDRLERFTAAWVGAACIGLFFMIAGRIQDAKTATVVTLLLASGSVMTSTVGHALWQHGGVIFWSLLFFFLELQFPARRAGRVSIIQGVCLGMTLACRPSAGLIVAVTTTWIAWRSRQRGLLIMLGAALGFIPWAILYECLYGMALGPTQSQIGSSNWGLSGNSLLGVLASPSCGLFVYQPWLLIGLVSGLWSLFALAPVMGRIGRMGPIRPITGLPDNRILHSTWRWYCMALIVLQVLLVANWKCWWGGDCWGSRLLADVIPFCALLCLTPTRFLMERRWGIGSLVVLGLVSIYIHSCAFHSESIFPARVQHPADWTMIPFIPISLHLQ